MIDSILGKFGQRNDYGYVQSWNFFHMKKMVIYGCIWLHAFHTLSQYQLFFLLITLILNWRQNVYILFERECIVSSQFEAMCFACEFRVSNCVVTHCWSVIISNFTMFDNKSTEKPFHVEKREWKECTQNDNDNRREAIKTLKPMTIPMRANNSNAIWYGKINGQRLTECIILCLFNSILANAYMEDPSVFNYQIKCHSPTTKII